MEQLDLDSVEFLVFEDVSEELLLMSTTMQED